MAEGDNFGGMTEGQTEAHQWLENFWPKTMNEIKSTKDDFKSQELPLARIKKIMKLDEDVKMISQEAPLLFAKAAEIFISELALRSWVQTEDSKRRTLQRNDISLAISKFDQFDFLIDIVPRDVEAAKPSKRQENADQGLYYVQTQTGLTGQTLQLGTATGIPAGAQVIQVQGSTQQQQAVQQIQLSPTALQQLQQQLGNGQQVVVQASSSGGFTPATVQGQQVQFVQQT